MQDSVLLLLIETIRQSGAVGLIELDRADTGEIQRTMQLELDARFGSAQTLAPAILQLIVDFDAATNLRGVDAVVVATGPGSFTGLRVGCMTAKTLAFALNRPLISVGSLEAMAWTAIKEGPADSTDLTRPFWTLLDAYRKQVFAAKWQWDRESQKLLCLHPAECVDWKHWGSQVDPVAEFVVADRASVVKHVPAKAEMVEILNVANDPLVSGMIEPARARYVAGEFDDPLQLMPNYLRGSAAEEKSRQSV